MRPRTRIVLALALAALASPRGAWAQSSSPTAGLVAGDYFRASGGIVTPINPSGSLKEWKQGNGFNLMWENWDDRGGRLGLFAFGLYGDLSFLPFDEDQFIADFRNGPFGIPTQADASSARIIQVGVNTRFRIPMPVVMPTISVGFGFLDWHPAQITYTAGGSSHTAKQQNRQGGVVTFIGGLDRQIYNRVGIFGEALYAYGYTSFGQTLAASGSACVQANCDLLKNTPLGAIRVGLRVRSTR